MSIDHVEDAVRAGLQDLAAEASPAPLLQRLEAGQRRATSRRGVALAAAAAALVVVLAVSLALGFREDRRVSPAVQPPKVLHLSDAATFSPGRALIAISLAADAGHDSTPAYVYVDGADSAVRLPDDGMVKGSWTQDLSVDGALFTRQQRTSSNPRVEIVDLRTGRVDDVGGLLAYCPALSPDGRSIAAVSFTTGDVVLIDRRTRRPERIASEGPECGYGSFGWSPDGDRLVVRSRTGSEVRDREGGLLHEIAGWNLVNSSMSWSPDGRDLLMYRPTTGSFAVVPADGSPMTLLPQPAQRARPVGWTGDRVVWLVRGTGHQGLVTTDRQGGDRAAWIRLDIGDRTVEAIGWSRDLSGAAAD